MKFLSLFVFAFALASVLAAPASDEKKSLGRKFMHSPAVQIIGQKTTDCIPSLVTSNVKKLAANAVLCAGQATYGLAQGLAISAKKHLG